MTVKPRPTSTRARKPATTKTASKTATAADTAPVDTRPLPMATIPDMSFYDSYVGRVLPGGITDEQLFDYALANQHNVLIEGPTGPGKTSAVMAYAAHRQMPFYAVPSSNDTDLAQLFGKFAPTKEGSFEWIDGPVTSIFRHGGILMMTEINYMAESLKPALYGAFDKRREITLVDHRGEVIKAHPNLLVVADMNPDYEGTRPLNKAFRNRFALQIEWDYDPNVEQKLIPSPHLIDMATKLRREHKAGTYETPCATNMLIEFVKFHTDLGFDMAKANFVTHFAGDERAPIALIVDTFRDGIERDLINAQEYSQELKDEIDRLTKLLEEGDGTSRNQYVEVQTDEDGNRRAVLLDPEWGEYGPDWVYDDDDDVEDEEL